MIWFIKKNTKISYFKDVILPSKKLLSKHLKVTLDSSKNNKDDAKWT